ncbi:hypothetical protein G5V59_22420 [Nocardioides sp. W3-2-3]|nr:hypothetical protein [Nocardioides convexus]
MTPDVDTFHALARSAPWRWRSLHFGTRSSSRDEVEAYVERPGRLSLRHADGTVERVVEERRDAVPLPHEVSPPLRADGLVARRPATFFEVRYDDPMWRNYSWVAMLDPEEPEPRRPRGAAARRHPRGPRGLACRPGAGGGLRGALPGLLRPALARCGLVRRGPRRADRRRHPVPARGWPGGLLAGAWTCWRPTARRRCGRRWPHE